MEVSKGKLAGLFIFKPRKFSDNRGSFFESFHQADFEKAVGHAVQFVQDNESISAQKVLRGLHFQRPPHAQGKLVRVVRGSVLDVAVDLRKDSPTYGQHQLIELSAENGLQFWIPPGFAHGFLSLEKDTVFAYKCTDYYHPETEGALLWNDPELNIQWGNTDPIVSGKDAEAGDFAIFASPF